MDKGWAFWAWAVENDGWLRFGGVKRKSKGYVAQELNRLLKSKSDG